MTSALNAMGLVSTHLMNRLLTPDLATEHHTRDEVFICDDTKQLERSLPNASREVVDTLRVVVVFQQQGLGMDVSMDCVESDRIGW